MCVYLLLGNGVFTQRDFKKGEFLLEYTGEVHNAKETEVLKQTYAQKNQGSYIYVVRKYWSEVLFGAYSRYTWSWFSQVTKII